MCVCVLVAWLCPTLRAHSPMELALIKLNRQRTQTQFLRGGCVCMRARSQSCPTLCDPIDCSPLLEHVAISFSRRSFQPRDITCLSCISCIARQVLYQLIHQ